MQALPVIGGNEITGTLFHRIEYVGFFDLLLHGQKWNFRLVGIFLLDDLADGFLKTVAIVNYQLDTVVTEKSIKCLRHLDPVTVRNMTSIAQGAVDEFNVVLIFGQNCN